MFSSCKESAGKSLANHLLKDGSRLEEGIGSPQDGLQAWIHVRLGMLGPLLGFDPFGPSEWRCWAKIHGTHNAPLFLAREFDRLRLEKYCVFYLVVIRDGGPLMLACSNVHVSGECSIFGIAFSTTFLVSHWFVTPIKGCKVTGFYLTD